MNKKIAIKKVVLEVNGKKIELSLSEAKELKEILCDAFPNKSIKINNSLHRYDAIRQPPYYQPFYYSGPTWAGSANDGIIYMSNKTDSQQQTSISYA
ncbi:MAG: hypothetical protein GY841_16185 [FCB group bacterium]|nr:hypothetical protein [FCB group bacterium]